MAISTAQLAQLHAIRRAMDAGVKTAAEKGAAAINECTGIIRQWRTGAYAIGDVRMFDGIPYKCVQAHDSTNDDTWTPAASPALWMQYHGTTKETARAWLAPTGAHDMYLAGEWMVYTDGKTYECISDTSFSPTDYADAWRCDE